MVETPQSDGKRDSFTASSQLSNGPNSKAKEGSEMELPETDELITHISFN